MFKKEALVMLGFFVGLIALSILLGLVGPRLFGPPR